MFYFREKNKKVDASYVVLSSLSKKKKHIENWSFVHAGQFDVKYQEQKFAQLKLLRFNLKVNLAEKKTS